MFSVNDAYQLLYLHLLLPSWIIYMSVSMFAPHHPQNHRRAKDGGHSADGKLRRRQHGARKQIAEQTEHAPAKKTSRYHQKRFRRAQKLFDQMGRAMPTKETGPANATIHADNILERMTMPARRSLRLTPTPAAYVSPIW